ncbi:hypothetical protein LEN26_010098 [Aphanomyces euteiches]|nr:hypothetical protein AeMF1_012120 [Aphanomyces euteiches]KAH9122798.1 hypothetical protein LEN26_010098 [Aphanomyces euteiches]KAH9193305.1 hypothetical protein AeNC1_004731 [Aphanomyces euteiches]
MGQKWSKEPEDYYLGNGGSPYGLNHITGILSHDRRTDVIFPEGESTVVIGSRSGLSLLDVKTKKNKAPDMLRRLGLVVRTHGSRLTKSASVVVTDMLRVDASGKLVPRNKTYGLDVRNWRGTKGPAEASGAIRIGDAIYSINGARVPNKSRSQIIKMLGELSSRQLIITFRHGETMAQVPWEMEHCIDPPEGDYVEPDNEWGFLTPMKLGSVSI